jgi:hypothetical protein
VKTYANVSYADAMSNVLVLMVLFSSIIAAAQSGLKNGSDLSPVKQGGKWGYVDKDGGIVIKPQFDVAHGFAEGLALAWSGGIPLTDPVVKSFVKMGYIDQKGEWVIQSRFRYYFYYDFSEGLVSFRQQSNEWGYMDSRGKTVVPARFQWAGGFSNGIAPVLLDDKCVHIDKRGKITDQAQSVLPRKSEQDGRGRFKEQPKWAPCS